MASPGDDSSSSSDSGQSRRITSPFVAFKKFADEQFSSLMGQTFGSNPFVLSPAVSYNQFKKDYDDWLKLAREEEDKMTRELTGDSGPSMRCPYREPAASASLTDEEARDLKFYIQSDEYGNLSGDPSTQSRPNGEQELPLSYILMSPYSPIHLETELSEVIKPTILRAAFEDLIRIDNGLPLSQSPPTQSHPQDTPPHQWASSILDLLLGLNEDSSPSKESSGDSSGKKRVCRLVYPWPHHESPPPEREEDKIVGDILSSAMNALRTLSEDNDEEEENIFGQDPSGDHKSLYGTDEPETEFDAYRRAMIASRPPQKSKILDLVDEQRREKHKFKDATETSSIISTLETTSTTKLPDGSVSTKVTLQKRFSDGREESVETHHQQAPPAEKPRIKAAASEKGWFWK